MACRSTGDNAQGIAAVAHGRETASGTTESPIVSDPCMATPCSMKARGGA